MYGYLILNMNMSLYVLLSIWCKCILQSSSLHLQKYKKIPIKFSAIGCFFPPAFLSSSVRVCGAYAQRKLNYKVILNDMTLYIVFATYSHTQHTHVHARSDTQVIFYACISNFGFSEFWSKVFVQCSRIHNYTTVTHAHKDTKPHLLRYIFSSLIYDVQELHS